MFLGVSQRRIDLISMLLYTWTSVCIHTYAYVTCIVFTYRFQSPKSMSFQPQSEDQEIDKRLFCDWYPLDSTLSPLNTCINILNIDNIINALSITEVSSKWCKKVKHFRPLFGVHSFVALMGCTASTREVKRIYNVSLYSIVLILC